MKRLSKTYEASELRGMETPELRRVASSLNMPYSFYGTETAETIRNNIFVWQTRGENRQKERAGLMAGTTSALRRLAKEELGLDYAPKTEKKAIVDGIIFHRRVLQKSPIRLEDLTPLDHQHIRTLFKARHRGELAKGDVSRPDLIAEFLREQELQGGDEPTKRARGEAPPPPKTSLDDLRARFAR